MIRASANRLRLNPADSATFVPAAFFCEICTYETEEGEKTEAANVVNTVATRIRLGRDVEHLRVWFSGDDLGVEIIPNEDSRYYYAMDSLSALRNPLRAKFGRPSRVKRRSTGEISFGVLPEISKYLGIEVEEAEVA